MQAGDVLIFTEAVVHGTTYWTGEQAWPAPPSSSRMRTFTLFFVRWHFGAVPKPLSVHYDVVVLQDRRLLSFKFSPGHVQYIASSNPFAAELVRKRWVLGCL